MSPTPPIPASRIGGGLSPYPLEQLTGVRFRRIMEANEAVDEEASSAAQLFDALRDSFGGNWFTAADVRRERLDPDHGVPAFASYMLDAARLQRQTKLEAAGSISAAYGGGVADGNEPALGGTQYSQDRPPPASAGRQDRRFRMA